MAEGEASDLLRVDAAAREIEVEVPIVLAKARNEAGLEGPGAEGPNVATFDVSWAATEIWNSVRMAQPSALLHSMGKLLNVGLSQLQNRQLAGGRHSGHWSNGLGSPCKGHSAPPGGGPDANHAQDPPGVYGRTLTVARW